MLLWVCLGRHTPDSSDTPLARTLSHAITITGLGNLVPSWVATSQQSLGVSKGDHECLVGRQFLSTTLCSHHTSFTGVPWALPALCTPTHTQPSLNLECMSLQTTRPISSHLSSTFFCSSPPIPSLCSFLQLRSIEVNYRAGILFRQWGLKS